MAYRFLRNRNVTADKILEPHHDSTRARIASEPVVLAVQDTTELNYTHLPAAEGPGTIGSSKKLRGMPVHTTIAFTPERVPLGVLAQQTWIRPPEEFGTKLKRKGDRRPGMTVLWRGLQGLTRLSGAWLSFGPEAQLPAEEQSP